MPLIAHVLFECFERPFGLRRVGSTLELGPRIGSAARANERIAGTSSLIRLQRALSRFRFLTYVSRALLLLATVVLVCEA